MVVVSECLYIHIYMFSLAERFYRKKKGFEATDVLSSLNQEAASDTACICCNNVFAVTMFKG